MRLVLSIALLLGLPVGAEAHEFWLSPAHYTVASGEPIALTTRIGENFKAGSRAYLPNTFVRYEVLSGGTARPVEGRMGDDPVTVTVADGLAVIVHETRDRGLRYTDPEKWPKFVAHKAFPDALERHAARGFGLTGFRERYRRFAKALVAVGDGAGADAPVGMRTEIVALANPYAEDLDSLPVRVLLEGAPRADAQVELFEKAPDGTVDITLHRTDAAGVARLPVRPGRAYLADAVTLLPLPNDDPEAGPVWETLWAALTFAIPER